MKYYLLDEKGDSLNHSETLEEIRVRLIDQAINNLGNDEYYEKDKLTIEGMTAHQLIEMLQYELKEAKDES